MKTAMIVLGRFEDARHIELVEPVENVANDTEVEVTLRLVEKREPPRRESVFDFISKLPPGKRTKEDIDAQIAEERASWGEP